MKRIISFSNLKSNAIRKNTNNTTFTFGFCLSEAPSGAVTITVSDTLSKYTRSASSFTFTTANWFTPQSITLTAVNDSVTDIVLTDNVIFSASGGGYDGVTLTLPIVVYDSVSFPYTSIYGHDTWSESLHCTSTNAQTLVNSAIAYFFNGNGIPSGTSNVTVTAGFTGTMQGSLATTDITGLVSCDRYTITWTDVDGATWTHYTYLLKSGVGTKLLIDVLGIPGSYNHDLLIESCMSAGIDVLYTGMPVVSQNTETSSKVTTTGVNGWNQMVSNGLDTASYSAVELFFFDIAKSLNYIVANYSYTTIGITGIHAGAWSALVYGALDSRITKVFPIRGLNPVALDNVTGPYPIGDNLAANGATLFNFYANTVSMVDYFAICSKLKYIKSLDHTADFSSSYATSRYWAPLVEAKVGGTIDIYMATAAGTATPAYYSDFITEITSEM